MLVCGGFPIPLLHPLLNAVRLVLYWCFVAPKRKVTRTVLYRRIESFIREYWDTHHFPVASGVVHQVFHGNISSLGTTLPTVLKSRRLKERTVVYLGRFGHRYLFPAEVWNGWSAEVREHVRLVMDTKPYKGIPPSLLDVVSGPVVLPRMAFTVPIERVPALPIPSVPIPVVSSSEPVMSAMDRLDLELKIVTTA